ncbi:pitrilysin family protein [Pedobacter sp. SYSU D00535]|uniref:M16 family metallopeptidase n=1 Tax=Pedobacter sp. SYSU D00535 TaxID=2810308 RepID=UPI001A975EA4|nr:pitrilysin family protein [Pedobacter sp. SYSU D00535]
MDYQVHTLPNGIRLLYKPFPSTITHACIIVNAGSRDEESGKDGLAHFIEHLLFKQTAKRNTNQILNRLESVGGDLNAYTTKEYTCIHASFLNPHLERALDLFEDLVFHSTFPLNEMAKEKSVILDEIASYQDQPEEAIQDDFEDLLFAGHELGRNILGTEETVKALEQTDILHFLASNYNTEEIVVGVIGSYDYKKLCNLFNKLFGQVPANKPIKKRQLMLSYQARQKKEEKPISQSHCIIGSPAYSIHDKNKAGLLLMNNILGGTGMTSRLNLEIREKYGIAYTIESNYTPLSDTGIFSIYFGTDVEKVEKALSLTHKELRRLREQRLTATSLHRAKQKFIGQIALGEENKLSLIIAMTKSLIDFNRVDTLEEVFDKINAVTEDQVLEISNEILEPAKLTTLLFQPADEE